MTLAMYIEDEREESYADGFADGESKGKNDGIIEGEKKRSRDIAIRLLQRGLPIEIIAEDTGLTMEQLRKLQQQH